MKIRRMTESDIDPARVIRARLVREERGTGRTFATAFDALIYAGYGRHVIWACAHTMARFAAVEAINRICEIWAGPGRFAGFTWRHPESDYCIYLPTPASPAEYGEDPRRWRDARGLPMDALLLDGYGELQEGIERLRVADEEPAS